MKLLFIILLPLLTIALLPLKKFSRLAFYISVCLLGITNIVLLPAVLITSHLTHYANFGDNAITNLSSKPVTASILLAMFIIGMSKNCVFPFNRWLPNTMQTPTPIAALIHSVAAVKVGSISLIKIAVYIYHLDFLHKLNANFFMTGWLTYLCGFTALYSTYKALKTSDLKVRFSESTVSQLSYIITAILTGTPTSILGAKLHIITHSIAKCCLFFIAGFPFLAGYLSKDLMLIEELHSGNYKASFFNPKPEEIENRAIPLSMKIAIILATLIIIAISIYTYTVVRVIESF
jgi:formate hydrogenlyase subunit 3/multisubunit Na+/H+ antiporter MnhD subunit